MMPVNLIDATKPINLPPRAQEQIKKIWRERAAVNAALRQKERGIIDNYLRHREDDDETITRRLRRFRYEQGLREARFLLTGQYRKSDAKMAGSSLRAFEYIYEKWKKAGYPFSGVKIPIEDLKKYLCLNRRQVFYILDFLENDVPHRRPGSKACPGLIFRLGKTTNTRFAAVTLPESPAYHERIVNTIALSVESKQAPSEPVISPKAHGLAAVLAQKPEVVRGALSATFDVQS